MYSVEFTTHAKKQFDKLPEEVKVRIKKDIVEIKSNPHINTKKLKGSSKYSIFSLRVGEYRVIMRIDKLIILLIDIGKRKNIYRKY